MSGSRRNRTAKSRRIQELGKEFYQRDIDKPIYLIADEGVGYDMVFPGGAREASRRLWKVGLALTVVQVIGYAQGIVERPNRLDNYGFDVSFVPRGELS